MIKKRKISTHKGFQITITSGLAGAIVLQSFGEVAMIATVFSFAMNLLWLWEEDVSAIVFGAIEKEKTEWSEFSQ